MVSNPPVLKPKSTTSGIETLFFEIRGAINSHPWLSFGALVGIICGLAVWGRQRIRRLRGSMGSMNGGGFFTLDGKDAALLGFPMSGSVGNGKVD